MINLILFLFNLNLNDKLDVLFLFDLNFMTHQQKYI